MGKRKFLVAGFLTLLTVCAMTLSGCDGKLRNAKDSYNEILKEKINNSILLNDCTTESLNKIEFTGADFEVSGNKYNITVNGIASIGSNKSKAYVNAGYEVDKNYFSELDSKSEKYEIINALAKIAEENDMTYLDVIPVSNLKSFNKSVTRSITSPIDDYGYSSGMVFGLSKPEFNEDEGYVMFQTKSYMEYSKTVTEVTYGITGVDADGNPQFGPVLVTKTYYEDFIQTTNVYVKASEEEMDAMKENNALVFDKFNELFENKEINNYTIQSVEVEKDLPFDTNMEDDASLDID